MITEASPEKLHALAQLQCSGTASLIFPLLGEFSEGLAELGQRASGNCPSAE